MEYRYSGVVKLKGPGATSSEAMTELEEAIDSALAAITDLDFEDAAGRDRVARVDFGPIHLFMPASNVRDTLAL